METDETLSSRRKRFLHAYLANGGNALAAAREAGYRHPKSDGYRLLQVPEIAAAVKEHLDALAMSAREVLGRLADQARGDIGEFIDLDVEVEVPAKGDQVATFRRPWVLNLAKARDAGLLHLVKKISYDRNGNPSLELYDAQAALVLIGRYHRLFTEKVEHSGSVTVLTFDEVMDGLEPGDRSAVCAAIAAELRHGGGGAEPTRSPAGP